MWLSGSIMKITTVGSKTIIVGFVSAYAILFSWYGGETGPGTGISFDVIAKHPIPGYSMGPEQFEAAGLDYASVPGNWGTAGQPSGTNSFGGVEYEFAEPRELAEEINDVHWWRYEWSTNLADWHDAYLVFPHDDSLVPVKLAELLEDALRMKQLAGTNACACFFWRARRVEQ
jgi:hypothetical protein